MTDRPILMSGPMVRALLREIETPGAGKTQTRRLAWNTKNVVPGRPPAGPDRSGQNIHRPTIWQSVKPGDRLWVRETWRTHAIFDAIPLRDLTTRSIHYDADGAVKSGKSRSSIHMPRWASRITLLVTATKMERLIDITDDDAMAEGCPGWNTIGNPGSEIDICDGFVMQSMGESVSPVGHFQIIWEQIHGDYSWFDNPEVVAITFRPVLANIDQGAEAE